MTDAFIGTIDAFRELIFSLSYLLGFVTLILGIYKARDYAENPNQVPFRAPAIYFIVAILLLWMPDVMRHMLSSFYGSTELTPFSYQASDDQGKKLKAGLTAIIMFIQLVGVIGFMRGLLMLKAMGGMGQSSEGAFPKAMTHIIGGILAVNIVGTVGLLAGTFGMDNPLDNPAVFIQSFNVVGGSQP